MPPTTTPRPEAGKRGEGQWKLGHREPLNPNERTKKDDDGLNVRARIETIYSKRGFDSIDPADLRGRMRWWGLYTQRRPGIDGGRTAVLEPEELDDRYFMLRVRLDGGALTTEQLRALGEISQTYARDTADVTDRQNIQYHWIEIESMPAIWQRLESLGMITTEACGDTPRVILGSPVAGIAADERSTRARRSTRSSSATSATRRSPTCPASSRRRSPGSRTSRTRSTTSRSSASCTPSTARASTCGSAAGSRPIRRSRSAWASGCRLTRSRTSGGRRLGLPGLRVPPAAAPRADQVPGRGLGRREVPAGAGGRVPAPAADRRPRARRPRERPIDHVGVHRAEGRARTTSGSPRRRDASPAPPSSRSPTPPNGPAPVGSG